MTFQRTCPSCGVSNSLMLKRCACGALLVGGPSAATPTTSAPAGKISLRSPGASAAAKPSAPAPAPVATSTALAVASPGAFRAAVGPAPAGAASAPPAPPVIVLPLSAAASSTPASGPSSLARRARHALVAATVAGVVAGVALLAKLVFQPGTVTRDATAKKAIVQVSTECGQGTGFFVRSPDQWAYVATAFHVVQCGSAITVARAMEIGHSQYYVEAYPEAELAAYDADNDLALIRLRNVKAGTFPALDLGNPVKEDPVKSYGFPARTLMPRQGLLSQEGKILSVGRFPVIDDRTGEVVRDNAVDGILISSSLEPGYSGGPTCNDHGEVVGVNASKDRMKTQHNGAISVEALRRLLATVALLDKRVPPTPIEVQELLGRITREYLHLPPDKRATRREHEFIAVTDQPGLRTFVSEVRRLDRDPVFNKELQLSGRALLGLVIALQPGSPLTTYHHESVQQALTVCEKQARAAGLFAQLAGIAEDDSDAVARAQCDEKAFRPLVWDLTAATLQWDAEEPERELSVAKVEQVDDDEPVYRASVTPRGTNSSFDIWVRQEGASLKLKLLNKEGHPYGLLATRPVSADALSGTWCYSRPRSPLPSDSTVSVELKETVQISAASSGGVTIRHEVEAHVYEPPGKLACKAEHLVGTLEQSFSGAMKAGGALVGKSGEPKYVIPSFDECKVPFSVARTGDAAMALKRRGDQLIVYHTSGSEFPDEVTFSRR